MDDESACQAIAELSGSRSGELTSDFADGEHMDLITAREDDSAVVGQLIRRMPGERGEAAPALEFGEAGLPSREAVAQEHGVRSCRVHQNDSNLSTMRRSSYEPTPLRRSHALFADPFASCCRLHDGAEEHRGCARG